MVKVELVELHASDQLRAGLWFKAGHVLYAEIAGGWGGRGHVGREGEEGCGLPVFCMVFVCNGLDEAFGQSDDVSLLRSVGNWRERDG